MPAHWAAGQTAGGGALRLPGSVEVRVDAAGETASGGTRWGRGGGLERHVEGNPEEKMMLLRPWRRHYDRHTERRMWVARSRIGN